MKKLFLILTFILSSVSILRADDSIIINPELAAKEKKVLDAASYKSISSAGIVIKDIRSNYNLVSTDGGKIYNGIYEARVTVLNDINKPIVIHFIQGTHVIWTIDHYSVEVCGTSFIKD